MVEPDDAVRVSRVRATVLAEVVSRSVGLVDQFGGQTVEPMGPAGIRAPLARRDQLLAANGNNGSFNSLTTDKIAIVLDPYHNHLDEVWFEINPAGVRGDQFNGDPSWDPVWDVATSVDSAGWSGPLSSVGRAFPW